MKRHRGKLLAACAVAGVTILLFAASPQEPRFEGRTLASWLEQLEDCQRRASSDMPEEAAPSKEAELRCRTAQAAVRSIGARSVPWLVNWVRESAKSQAFRAKIQALLAKQNFVDINIPDRKDRSFLAVLAFETLGPAAASGLPELGRMLLNPLTCDEASACLYALGPLALPVVAPGLTNSEFAVQRASMAYLQALAAEIGPPVVPLTWNVVTNPVCHFRAEALLQLGDLGCAAAQYLPTLESMSRTPSQPLAGVVLRVLPELNPRPESYLQLFAEQLSNTNLSTHAAFALAQLGELGVPSLILAITNEHVSVRTAALAALRAKQARTGLFARPPAQPFSRRSSRFDTELRTQLMAYGNVGEPFRVALTLADHLNHSNPAVRLQIVHLLSSYGFSSALGLSMALGDPDEAVRAAATRAVADVDFEVNEGAIVRGPKRIRQVAVVFTGDEYGEGGETILNELKKHSGSASFFFTGRFLTKSAFNGLVDRAFREGHYIGPHSDQHLLYCSWESPKNLLVSHDQFDSDFTANIGKLQHRWGLGPLPHFFVPPYEHYNREIVAWASHFFFMTINLTPGTRSAADYTWEADTNFVSSQAIFDSIIAREQNDPSGLKGYILLFHIGSGEGRADKFHVRFGELLDYLTAKGYRFVAIDDMFNPAGARERRQHIGQQVEAPGGAMEAFRRRYGLR